jgi:hypothetical protein
MFSYVVTLCEKVYETPQLHLFEFFSTAASKGAAMVRADVVSLRVCWPAGNLWCQW